MFSNYSEQFQNSLKPVNDLMAVNVKTLEELARLQAALFTGVLDAGVDYMQGLTAKKGIGCLIHAQKTCAEQVQEKMLAAAGDTYGTIARAQEQAVQILESAFAQAAESAARSTGKKVKAGRAARP